MATIKELIYQINAFRYLGRKNLESKGVIVSKYATAYGIADAISRIQIAEPTAKADAGIGRMIPMSRVERTIAEALGPNYSQEELKRNTVVTADYYTE